MQSVSQDSLFNPYLTSYVRKEKPHTMEDHVKSYAESGLTQIEYCRVNRLSYSKLVYWLKKIRNRQKNAQTPTQSEPVLYHPEETQSQHTVTGKPDESTSTLNRAQKIERSTGIHRVYELI